MISQGCVFFFVVEYLLDDGRKRPKHVGGLLYDNTVYTFVSNYCAGVRINIVKCISYLMHIYQHVNWHFVV